MARMPVQISPRCRWRKQQGTRGRLLENLDGNMAGFIDNAKANKRRCGNGLSTHLMLSTDHSSFPL